MSKNIDYLMSLSLNTWAKNTDPKQCKYCSDIPIASCYLQD